MFISPIVVGVVVFQFFPILVSMGASLTSWNGISAPKFVGLQNFRDLFGNDPLFVQTFRNTIYFTLASIPLTIGVGLVLALLCSRPIKGRGVLP